MRVLAGAVVMAVSCRRTVPSRPSRETEVIGTASLPVFAGRGRDGYATGVTYSIVARDPGTGEMGVATQSQAFAVGSSVPFALPGHGVIATQSMAEPMYGSVGLDLLQGGFTAQEVLTALSSVDPHPQRRQVAVLGVNGDLAAYTGESCVEAAGHLVGETCVGLANMASSPAVWEAMVERFEASAGPLPQRLLSSLQAGEEGGGDFRGRRSAAIMVIRATTTGRPWQDMVVDLRVDDSPDPLDVLADLIPTPPPPHSTSSPT